ncbi:transposase [Streptomyces sp. 1222.5]|uniref:transposase n=1 Tax=Streptomyces sp. 1222.5 TaxID=1881026 RepID=UPI003EBA55BD
MGSNRTKRYTAEFKRDAVALVDSTGRTVTEVARELGVSPESLRAWYKQARVDRGEGRAGELARGRQRVTRRELHQALVGAFADPRTPGLPSAGKVDKGSRQVIDGAVRVSFQTWKKRSINLNARRLSRSRTR